MKSIPTTLACMAVLMSVAALSGCRKAQTTEAAAPKPPRDAMEITAADDMMSRITVSEAAWGEVAGQLRVAGRVEADETRIANVSTPLGGRIIELDVVEGQHVTRGQVIAIVQTTELSTIQSEYLKFQSQKKLAERSFERARRLLEAGVIGEAELQRREAELNQVTTELAGSRDHLTVLGMSERDIERLDSTRAVNSRSHILATIDGTILKRHVTIGQVVQTAEIVCAIADLSHVWLVADVPEQAAGGLAIGKPAKVTIPSLPSFTYNGKLSFVSATVNPETRTVSTRMTLANPQRRFKPAMLAEMTIHDAGQRRLVIPTEAVVRESNQDYVFIEKAPRSFVLRPVKLDGESRSGHGVIEGLQEGSRIVTRGAFHLNNERKRMALQGS